MSMEEFAVRYTSSQRFRRGVVEQRLQVLATRNSTPILRLPLFLWCATCVTACPLLRVCDILVVILCNIIMTSKILIKMHKISHA
jgi:hypothetical protein